MNPSITTALHLERIERIRCAMRRLSQLNLDVIDVNYDSKQIIIDTPPQSFPVKEIGRISSNDQRTTQTDINGIRIIWPTRPQPKEVRYGS